MLEQKDLELIQELLAASEERTAQRAAALMDLEFGKRFNLLAENQQIMLEMMKKLVPESRMESAEGDISALKAAVRTNRKDIDKLREAI